MMMKTEMKETSLEAYDEIKPKLQPKEKRVLEIIQKHQPISNGDISEKLFWPINCVTGRTNSLVKKDLVKEVDVAKNRFNRNVIRWGIA